MHALMGLGDTDWMNRAACAGMDQALFFPEMGGSRVREAQAVCARCPVCVECNAYARRNEINYGIWGGRSQYSRR